MPGGKAMGDKELPAEDKVDKAKGAVHEVVGDVKGAARKASEEDKKMKLTTPGQRSNTGRLWAASFVRIAFKIVA
jgi:hypothetical protein